MSEDSRSIDRGGQFAPKAAVLIGHSHAAAIFEAAGLQSEMRVFGPDLWAFHDFGYDGAGDILHPEVRAHLKEGTVFSALGGFAHALLGLVQHPQPFDFVLPDREDMPLAPGAEVIPYAAIRDAAENALFDYHSYMRRVRREASGRMYHISQPPVLRDSSRILGDMPWDKFPVAGDAVSPSDLRLKLWHLTIGLTRTFCAEQDIIFIDCPQDALDADGFIRSDLYDGAFHANSGYGALVLEQMKALL